MASPRLTCQTLSPASQASQLPQVWWRSKDLMPASSANAALKLWVRACLRWHHRDLPARPYRLHRRQASSHRSWGASAIWGHHCGSGLARDGIGVKYLTDRTVSIAGKPDPTGHGVLRYLGTSLWERACSRWHQREIPDRPGRKHRRQASSHRSWGASAIWGHHCGSGLARDGISAKHLTDRAACIAGKPAPTGHGVLRYLGASLWERACSRWHQREIPDRPCRMHRRQASSH